MEGGLQEDKEPEMLKEKWNKFLGDERGLETVEYAIITGLVVAASITAITAIGAWVSTEFAGLQTTVGA